MAEYIKREAVFKQFDNGEADVVEIYPDGSVDYGFGASNIRDLVNSVPAADVVPVVRCKDCAHLYGTFCTVCGLLPRKPDDFCSCGERKDGTDSDTDGSI